MLAISPDDLKDEEKKKKKSLKLSWNGQLGAKFTRRHCFILRSRVMKWLGTAGSKWKQLSFIKVKIKYTICWNIVQPLAEKLDEGNAT